MKTGMETQHYLGDFDSIMIIVRCSLVLLCLSHLPHSSYSFYTSWNADHHYRNKIANCLILIRVLKIAKILSSATLLFSIPVLLWEAKQFYEFLRVGVLFLAPLLTFMARIHFSLRWAVYSLLGAGDVYNFVILWNIQSIGSFILHILCSKRHVRLCESLMDLPVSILACICNDSMSEIVHILDNIFDGGIGICDRCKGVFRARFRWIWCWEDKEGINTVSYTHLTLPTKRIV